MTTEGDKKFHISPLTQKLMFKGGKMPESSASAPAAALMSDEALSVCQLLAIDPEDILPRTVQDFQDPTSKVSQQRLQLRHEYYEEKRQLKVKAIENILIKC